MNVAKVGAMHGKCGFEIRREHGLQRGRHGLESSEGSGTTVLARLPVAAAT
jgi:hypothetical protein